MASLKEVRNRIGSVTSTQQITKAMKMVAAAKLKRAQDKINQMRPYASKLQEILSNVSGNTDSDEGLVYTQNRDIKNVLLVGITSDRGLCGAFNANIIKKINQLIDGEYAGKQVTVLSVGKKVADHYGRRDNPTVDDYAGIFGDLSFDTAKEAAEYAMDSFADGTYDRIELVYNVSKNVATQIIHNDQFLPIPAGEVSEGEEAKTVSDYIYEPDQEFIIKELIPKSLKIQFYKALLESNASEHGARMTAMDSATDNAGELLKDLKLTYNRTRQAAITKEILEIVGGAEALANN